MAGQDWPAASLAVRPGEEVVVVAGTAAVGEQGALLQANIKVESLQLTSARSGVRRLQTVRLRLLLPFLLRLLLPLLLLLLGLPAGSLALSERVEVVFVALTASKGELSALS